MATAQDVDLSETWIRGQYNKGTLDTLSDPFDIVNDHQKYQKTNTSGSTSTNKDIPYRFPREINCMTQSGQLLSL